MKYWQMRIATNEDILSQIEDPTDEAFTYPTGEVWEGELDELLPVWKERADKILADETEDMGEPEHAGGWDCIPTPGSPDHGIWVRWDTENPNDVAVYLVFCRTEIKRVIK